GRGPQRRQRAERTRPELLTDGKGDESLGRGMPAVPVVLVLLAHAPQVDRERRIPRHDVARIRDARILRCQRGVAAEALHRYDAAEDERRRPREQAVVIRPQEVLELDDIAWRDAEI